MAYGFFGIIHVFSVTKEKNIMAKSVKKTVKSKVGGGLKKLGKGADWLGFAAGYFGTIASAGGEGIDNIIAIHKNAIVRHNVFALTDIPNRIQDPNWNPFLITGVIMTVGGKLVQYLPSFVPYQNTVAGIVSKAGFGMAVGSGVAIGVSELAMGSGPFDGSGGGGTSAVWKVPKGRTTTTSGKARQVTHSTGYARPAQ